MQRLLYVMAVLLLAACSDSSVSTQVEIEEAKSDDFVSPEPLTKSKDSWLVIDAFEVGRDVYVRSMAVDEANNTIWVGTSTGVHEVGLIDQLPKNTFTRADGLANEYLFSIFIERDGHKWFGTNGGGASRYKEGNWQVFFPMHGLADYWIYSFAQQADGKVWIGTWAGANLWDPEANSFETYFDELINEWVYGLDVDSKDQVWFGTEGGVSMFDGTDWHSWTHKDGLGAKNTANLPISLNTGLGTRSRHDLGVNAEGQSTYNPNYIFSILVDRNDDIWAGTWGAGVSRFDGKKWHNYSIDEGLAGNIVYSIAEAKDGTLWFGTDRGLSRFDGEHWFNYDRHDGLLSAHVYTIAIASETEVWVGTQGGVTRFGLSDVQQDLGKTE